MFKIEEKYLNAIIAGEKNYEIRKLEEENEEFQDIVLGKEDYLKFCDPENEMRFKCKCKIKGVFISKFKDVKKEILQNIFLTEDLFYIQRDMIYDLELIEEGIKPFEEALILKEMQKFYGKNFTENTEVIVFHLDN